jgi:pre-mRNA-splicing factor CDC5/CEF1
MDEDEKEMLSEARARLANTRGKKAKRKAREAQLDEARRLASLQKKRELKAAGIYASRLGATRRGGKFMDYDKEVPFQKLAPAGFYDVGPEKAASAAKRAGRADADFEAIRLDKFEEQRRDEAERIAQRDDRKKRAKLMKQNLPAAVAQLSRLNDPASKLRRSELSLPAPQVTDSELEDVASRVEIQFRAPDAIPARWRGDSTPSPRRCPRNCGSSMAWRFTKVSSIILRIT